MFTLPVGFLKNRLLHFILKMRAGGFFLLNYFYRIDSLPVCIDLTMITLFSVYPAAIFFTLGDNEVNLSRYYFVTADLTQNLGGNYIIYGHCSDTYGHSFNRLSLPLRGKAGGRSDIRLSE